MTIPRRREFLAGFVTAVPVGVLGAAGLGTTLQAAQSHKHPADDPYGPLAEEIRRIRPDRSVPLRGEHVRMLAMNIRLFATYARSRGFDDSAKRVIRQLKGPEFSFPPEKQAEIRRLLGDDARIPKIKLPPRVLAIVKNEGVTPTLVSLASALDRVALSIDRGEMPKVRTISHQDGCVGWEAFNQWASGGCGTGGDGEGEGGSWRCVMLLATASMLALSALAACFFASPECETAYVAADEAAREAEEAGCLLS